MIPIEIIILMAMTSINFALATEKENKARLINIVCTTLGFIVIFYNSIYNGI